MNDDEEPYIQLFVCHAESWSPQLQEINTPVENSVHVSGF
jgi:hypothetical protein